MIESRDLYDLIREIILEEISFLKHYLAKVVNVNDPLKLGRVQVTLPEIGLINENSIWCFPRQNYSLVFPKVGNFVEVYFLYGDINRPVYLFPCNELKENVLKNWNGNIKESILFESPDNKTDNIKFNSSTGFLTFFDGTKKAVLGDDLKTYLTNFINNIFNIHTHSGVMAGGGTTGTPILTGTAPTNSILSSKVKLK